MSAPLPQEQSYTFEDVLSWPESERIELLYGEPVMMSPPNRKHQEISGVIYAHLHNYLEGKTCKVYHAPFGVRLFEEKGDRPDEVDTMVEPDITLVCDPEKLDDQGCIGAPDLVVEILSPSTQRHDRLTKFNLYQSAGVREYWIVDPESQTVAIYALEDGQYHAATIYTQKDSAPVGVLEDCKIDLTDVFQD